MNKLWLRLSLSFLAVILLAIGAVAWVVSSSVQSRFDQYVKISNMARFGGDIMGELERYYVANGTWQGVETLLPSRGQGEGSGSGMGRGAQIFITDADGVIMASTQPEWIGQLTSEIGPSQHMELIIDGQMVGTLGEQTPGTVALQEAEEQFLADTTAGLIVTAVVGGLMTFGLGIGLSYTLTRPLEHLTENISRWKLRESQQPVNVGGTDEIRRLGTAFNDLLKRLTDGEAQRQRMTADVAHELRTPVAIMRGHLEAMMDGVYPLDASHLAVAYDQVLHLTRLVEDLRLLTLAEAGQLSLNPSEFDMLPAIHASIERFAPLTQDRGINVAIHLPENCVAVYADPNRIQQVLDNLLSNAVRHAPANGNISVTAVCQDDHVSVSIFNQSEQSLNDEQIIYLFNRFWRGEDARKRDTGGSGLGLAITRELLRLQGGDIHAEREGDGLKLIFTLPASKT